MIAALFMQLGKRGMTIDAIRHGNMEIIVWNEKVWDFTSPIVLQCATASKGDKADSAMSLEQVMNHRCPNRDSMAWLGLYFAYQFFTVRTASPRLSAVLFSTTRTLSLHHTPSSSPLLSAYGGAALARGLEDGPDARPSSHPSVPEQPPNEGHCRRCHRNCGRILR